MSCPTAFNLSLTEPFSRLLGLRNTENLGNVSYCPPKVPSSQRMMLSSYKHSHSSNQPVNQATLTAYNIQLSHSG